MIPKVPDKLKKLAVDGLTKSTKDTKESPYVALGVKLEKENNLKANIFLKAINSSFNIDKSLYEHIILKPKKEQPLINSEVSQVNEVKANIEELLINSNKYIATSKKINLYLLLYNIINILEVTISKLSEIKEGEFFINNFPLLFSTGGILISNYSKESILSLLTKFITNEVLVSDLENIIPSHKETLSILEKASKLDKDMKELVDNDKTSCFLLKVSFI